MWPLLIHYIVLTGKGLLPILYFLLVWSKAQSLRQRLILTCNHLEQREVPLNQELEISPWLITISWADPGLKTAIGLLLTHFRHPIID